jgi:hypothetical protein
MSDVKETKEVVIGLLVIAKELALAFKDGVQVADAAVLFAKLQEPAIKDKLMAAYENIDLVKEEVKEVSLAEGLGIIQAALPELMALIEAVKK